MILILKKLYTSLSYNAILSDLSYHTSEDFTCWSCQALLKLKKKLEEEITSKSSEYILLSDRISIHEKVSIESNAKNLLNTFKTF